MEVDQQRVAEYNSMLYSGWEHPFKHFNQQLMHLKCANSTLSKDCIASGLREIMAQINGKRMYSGADMRFQGLQLSKMENCQVVLFTALGP